MSTDRSATSTIYMETLSNGAMIIPECSCSYQSSVNIPHSEHEYTWNGLPNSAQ